MVEFCMTNHLYRCSFAARKAFFRQLSATPLPWIIRPVSIFALAGCALQQSVRESPLLSPNIASLCRTAKVLTRVGESKFA